MESETDVLEMTSPLLSNANKDHFDKVSELKETFESQKKWISTLMQTTFPIQLIPPENIVAVAKKVSSFPFCSFFQMKVESFVGLMKSCKWVNAVITQNRSTFIPYDFEVIIDYNKIKENKLLLENFQYYHFHEIIFSGFENNVDELLAVLNSLNGTVLATHVHLINTVAIEELFWYFRPTCLTVEVRSSSSHSHCPIATVTRDTIPGHLRQINVVLDGPSTVELLENVISHFVGKSVFLNIRVSLKKMSLDTLYDQLEVCMKNLAIYRRKQKIFFELTEYLIDNEHPIVRFFQSKAKSSGLLSSPCKVFSYLHLFCKAEPGLVATLLAEQFCNNRVTMVSMSHCPTKRTFYEVLYNFYSSRTTHSWTLTELEEKIEDHFFSTNVNDACYDSFETIEKQEFKLRPKQLEASELQLILDWKQRKPLPQLSWRLPVTEQMEQQLDLLGEAVDIQKQWITFLKKGKVILNEIPRNCLLEIFKKMDTETFVKALRTCKKIKNLIDYGRPTFRKYVQKELRFTCREVLPYDQKFGVELKDRDFFRFKLIRLIGFGDEDWLLQSFVSSLADRTIFCHTLELNDTVLTQKMMEYLRPSYIHYLCPRYVNDVYRIGVYYGGPQNYPEHVIQVSVDVKYDSWLIPVVEDLAGKHFMVNMKILLAVLLEQRDQFLLMQATRYCIEKIKSRRGSGRFVFSYDRTCFRVQDINQEEISQGHDCFSYIRSTDYGKTFIFVAKAAGGVVAGVFSDYMKKFLWQFITTMEDFEKLFADGTIKDDRILGPEDEIAFSTIRSYFSQ